MSAMKLSKFELATLQWSRTSLWSDSFQNVLPPL